jgi:MFS family permease
VEIPKQDPYAALRHRDFRFFLAGKFLLTVALQMQATVAAWLIYQQTKDPLSLGLIGLSEAVPALGLALPGGILADRFDRRMIMLASSTLMLTASLAFVYFILGGSALLSAWPAYMLIFVIGLARGLFVPAQSALWGKLLPSTHYVNGSVWNSSLWQIGAVSGPAVGGLCYAWIGAGHTMILVCLLIGLALLSYMAMNGRKTERSSKAESVMESLESGLRFFFGHKLLLSAVTLDLVAVLFGGAVALLPAFADEVLHCGPEGLGYLRAAPALGAVMMGLYLAFRPPAKKAGILMMWCIAGFGCCMIGFALSEAFWLSMALLVMSGMFDNVSVIIRSTILQSHTPDEMRGRVSAVNSLFVGSSNEIGAFESGLAAKLFGLVPSVVGGGIITIASVIITSRLSPSLRKLNL